MMKTTVKFMSCVLFFILLVGYLGNKQGVKLSQNEIAGSKRKPNVIFILADDLGYGDLGSNGQTKIRTPNLDLMAEQGISFNQHYAGAPVCGPSRASLLTGLHPGNSPIRGNPKWTKSGRPVELDGTIETIGDVFKQSEYRTGLIGKWAMADAEELNLSAMPNQNGFDYFFGFKTHLEAHHYYWHRLFLNNSPYVLEGNDFKNKKGIYTHDLFTDKAIEFVDKNQDAPFFLFLSYTIPHLEATVPEDSKQQYLDLGWPKRMLKTDGHYKNDAEGHTAYAGMISRMDRDIGKLKRHLEKLGLAKDTLIIFTSDNGHEFDSANPKKHFFDSNADFRGGKRDLYEGGIRMPFIAYWPEKIQPGVRSDHISAFWDFKATACDLIENRQCSPSDGISFLPTLLSDSHQETHKYLYWEFNEKQGPIQALRFAKWKLLKFENKIELYDLENDPSESVNIAERHHQVVSALLLYMNNSRTEHPEFPLDRIPWRR